METGINDEREMGSLMSYKEYPAKTKELLLYCCYPTEKKEARGYVLTSASRGGVVIFGALFASVAINAYAESVANCSGNVFSNGDEGGIKASSVLAYLGAVEGVVNALLSPFMGSLADTTPHRKLLVGFAIMSFTVLVGLQGFFFLPQESTLLNPSYNETNDLKSHEFLLEPKFKSDTILGILLFTVVIQVVCYEMAALLTTTYASELSHSPEIMAGYVGLAYTLLNGMQLVMVILVTGFQLLLGLRALQLGSVGAVVAIVLTLFWFIPGYMYLGERKEVSDELKKGYCGLAHLVESVKELRKYKQITIMLVSWLLASASLSSITVLSTSYLQFHLGYEGSTVSAILGFALLMSVPGSLLTRVMARVVGLKKWYIGVLVAFGISFIAAPILMVADTVPNLDNNNTVLTRFGECDVNSINTDDEEQTSQEAPGYVFFITLVFTGLWGLGIGAIYPCNNALYALLIPGGKEVTAYGLKVTFSKVLTWMPPLVFATINENFDDIRFSIIILAPFFFMAAGVGSFIDMEQAALDVRDTLHRRRGDFNKGASAGTSEKRVAPTAFGDKEDESDDDEVVEDVKTEQV